MRLTDDTAKLRRSMGVQAAVGRRATAGRRSREAMGAVVVRCVAGGERALWGRVCDGGKGWRIQLINWKECWFVSRVQDIFGGKKSQLMINSSA